MLNTLRILFLAIESRKIANKVRFSFVAMLENHASKDTFRSRPKMSNQRRFSNISVRSLIIIASMN